MRDLHWCVVNASALRALVEMQPHFALAALVSCILLANLASALLAGHFVMALAIKTNIARQFPGFSPTGLATTK